MESLKRQGRASRRTIGHSKKGNKSGSLRFGNTHIGGRGSDSTSHRLGGGVFQNGLPGRRCRLQTLVKLGERDLPDECRMGRLPDHAGKKALF